MSRGRPRVLLATDEAHAALIPGDRLLARALEARGFTAQPAVWSRTPPESLDGSAAVVVRSCWDYHLRPDAFAAWIRALEGRGVRLLNPPAPILWNLHKRYLLELAGKGARVVPTRLVPRGAAPPLAGVLAEAGWAEAVVKPAVSLSAYETWRTTPAEAAAHQARFAALARAGDVLVQSFLPEVASAGEWSLVFLGGEYSHAVRKRARAGDFRVQDDHGGTAALEEAPPSLVEEAGRLLALLPGPLPYARVDGVEVEGALVLMELECIDPDLFLALHPPAAQRLAEVVAGLAAPSPVAGGGAAA